MGNFPPYLPDPFFFSQPHIPPTSSATRPLLLSPRSAISVLPWLLPPISGPSRQTAPKPVPHGPTPNIPCPTTAPGGGSRPAGPLPPAQAHSGPALRWTTAPSRGAGCSLSSPPLPSLHGGDGPQGPATRRRRGDRAAISDGGGGAAAVGASPLYLPRAEPCQNRGAGAAPGACCRGEGGSDLAAGRPRPLSRAAVPSGRPGGEAAGGAGEGASPRPLCARSAA